ncbi:MAG TPA: GNAT family N-acetyltransferase [Candidatus Hydrogenedens sp.]|nr:GNAT family N-acetyltransferase [Candidatus Hydrogenedens sp.]
MLNIREINEGEIGKAVESLVQAFYDDRLVCYMFPDSKLRKEFITWFYFRWIQLLMKFNSVFVENNVRGVAVCVPPKLFPHIPLSYQIRAGLLGTISKLGLKNLWKPLRVYLDSQRRTKSEVKEPSWILDILGVQPEFQGKGIGSTLVQHLISLSNRDKVPAYLITHNEKNIVFYENNGFKLLKKEHSLTGGPPTCSLKYNPY